MSHKAPEYVSLRQRTRNNTSGANVSRVLRGEAPVRECDEVRPNAGRRHGNPPHNNFATPREFFSGPRQPPRQSSGIRRNPDANRDSVGYMLTDEYLMTDNGANGSANGGGAQSYGAPAKRGQGASRARDAHNAANKSAASAPGGYRDGLTYNCIVTAPEKEWHSGVKITRPQDPMDAPYFEDTDPRPARDAAPTTGKRHVRAPYKDAKMFGQVPLLKEGEEGFDNGLPPCHKTSNRANESVDVLNLYSYSPEELSEKPQPKPQLGPRRFDAPDAPPRRSPMFRPINTKAKQEHDILGTGRWGVPEEEHPRGLARGSCRPPRSTANLFSGGIPPAEDSAEGGRGKKRADPVFNDADRPRKALSKKNAGTPDLLRYYDPTVDPKPAPRPTKRNGQRVNQETHEPTPSETRPTGKGRGEFSSRNRGSVILAYA
ncbi:hypothetical protein ABB37_04021 [Leptomonas pyrrhocoris]|uniref:Flagellum targeting protein kharon1 n=1 Tax=Leptomonas pyrrhocoris TaxID=157538 RepID=A0A0M9G3P5_LEPPY|nr:hypothetical protein ABB37_04021 [Leptomonas pyrrhocoris]XP_015660164.1 hypothetical protein ABB37_04021 [Leptomonas pyrrhocoris]XP_015660165.1 hypothetical protein ABB37_04021 [Leptomonas pyrrhocoris]XP_015660166.1 hypothetical protein ABB37_04021 [Leptomonas pyrrhocoris]XP_015660167.1 hypothetical protein ABB37_04021 [Leptomonas pyrrhocoris]KPA81724.1 hypothetical protein ABB37_04021 [Leptomonas pyrrhocoris]KPA81725.1 hypothetical protein ABB37_04021 [Leptomonas pyrrhocoris]KPA81726.1 h|eukprot:XP_015660163.1 hypothetical protein ABB37_04021 [Leptomonas pyrrhocoris]